MRYINITHLSITETKGLKHVAQLVDFLHRKLFVLIAGEHVHVPGHTVKMAQSAFISVLVVCS